VLDVRDLWPAAAEALGELKNPRLVSLAARLESFLYRHADRITAVTQGFIAHISRRVSNPSKVQILSNGASIEVFDPARAEPGLKRRIGLADRFVVSFAGLHGIAQGLEVILEAAALLGDRPDVVFCLIGQGPRKAALEARAQAEGLANVRFLPPVPLAE